MKRYVTVWNVAGLMLFVLGLLILTLSQPGRRSEVVNLPAEESLSLEPRNATLRLYFAKSDASGFLIEKRQVVLGPGESVYQRALAELVAGPQQGAAPIIPQGAPVPDVFVRGATAFVDLPSRYSNLGLGTTGEMLLIYGIAYTLTDQGAVDEVRFLYNGEPAVTLGHISLLEPIRRRR